MEGHFEEQNNFYDAGRAGCLKPLLGSIHPPQWGQFMEALANGVMQAVPQSARQYHNLSQFWEGWSDAASHSPGSGGEPATWPSALDPALQPCSVTAEANWASFRMISRHLWPADKPEEMNCQW